MFCFVVFFSGRREEREPYNKADWFYCTSFPLHPLPHSRLLVFLTESSPKHTLDIIHKYSNIRRGKKVPFSVVEVIQMTVMTLRMMIIMNRTKMEVTTGLSE